MGISNCIIAAVPSGTGEGMRIAVVGGGNGSYAAAADLAERGHEVRLWRRDAAAFAPVLERGSLTLKGLSRPTLREAGLATTSLSDTLAQAELILAPIPAFGQVDLARTLSLHLHDGQVGLLPPGSFGSYVMAREIAAAGTTKGPRFCRVRYIAVPRAQARAGRDRHHDARNAAADRCLSSAARCPCSCDEERGLSRDRAGRRRAKCRPDERRAHHPSAADYHERRADRASERWDIHNEGTQASIRRVTTALDDERIAVRQALDYRPPHVALADHYDSDRWMCGNLAHDTLVGSGDWRERLDLQRHRYMREDVAYGLAFLVSVAAWAGVPSPVALGLLSVASAMLSEDLAHGPRTLSALGSTAWIGPLWRGCCARESRDAAIAGDCRARRRPHGSRHRSV
jgi:opine dehydrogenase